MIIRKGFLVLVPILLLLIVVVFLGRSASAELRTRVVVRSVTNSITILTADPTTAAQGIRIEGYSRLALFCRDNAGTPARIQGVETATYELWFYGPDTLWHTNSADNIDVSETDDHFGFEMHGYTRFALRKASGDTFFCAVTVD